MVWLDAGPFVDFVYEFETHGASREVYVKHKNELWNTFAGYLWWARDFEGERTPANDETIKNHVRDMLCACKEANDEEVRAITCIFLYEFLATPTVMEFIVTNERFRLVVSKKYKELVEETETELYRQWLCVFGERHPRFMQEVIREHP